MSYAGRELMGMKDEEALIRRYEDERQATSAMTRARNNTLLLAHIQKAAGENGNTFARIQKAAGKRSRKHQIKYACPCHDMMVSMAQTATKPRRDTHDMIHYYFTYKYITHT
jgi:hypothetical protein